MRIFTKENSTRNLKNGDKGPRGDRSEAHGGED